METPSANDNPITPFAITNYRDIRKRFGIKQKNRRGHMYVIGKTGTGKSTLLLNMASHDIESDYGLALIDPHGDLAEQVLAMVPKGRIKDVVYLNPADLEWPVAFNPLENVPHDARHLAASGIISALKKVWAEFWGPRLEHILRHALLTLLENPGSTLLDLPRLLTNETFRAATLRRVFHPQLREFWFSEFAKYSVWLRSEAIAPILNKVGQFSVTLPLRNVFGQRRSRFEFRQVMDEGKILIVNLAKGRIGEDNCALLGALVVTQIQLAALSRADIPETKRRPFYLYVDEFHNFLTLSFADILAEARKYGLNLILAHQHLEQLDEKLRAAVFGNVGTLISFRVGAEDARLLAREFYPTFGEADLANLPNYHIYLKLLIDGAPSQPFSAVTLPPAPHRVSHATEIVEHSRTIYARPRREVEQEILRGPSYPPTDPEKTDQQSRLI